MKRNLRSLVLTVLTLSTLVVAPIVAAEGNSGSSGSSGSSGAQKPAETSDKKTDAENETETHNRLEKQKTDLKIKLTSSESERLKTRCKPAQTVVKTEHDRFSSKVVGRTRAYAELTDKLDKLVARLKAKNVDVTELQNEIAVLQTKIATFNADLAAYKQALSDLRLVNCTTDPTAFQAALVTARTAHEALLNDAKDIRSYVKDTIKVTLHSIKTALEAEEKTNKTEEGAH